MIARILITILLVFTTANSFSQCETMFFISKNTDEICPGSNVEFMLFAYNLEKQSVTWNFSDGSSFSGLVLNKAFSNTGMQTFSVTINRSCGIDTILIDSIKVSSNPPYMGPTMYWEASGGAINYCPGAKNMLYTTGSQDNLWEKAVLNLGDGTAPVMYNPSIFETGISYFVYPNAGTFPFSLTFTDICKNDTVFPATAVVGSTTYYKGPSSVIKPYDTLCPGVLYEFGANEKVYKQEWFFLDGTTETLISKERFSKSFTTSGIVYFQVKLTDYCGKDTILDDYVVVGDKKLVDPFYMLLMQDSICINSPIYISLSTNSATAFHMDMGNGQSFSVNKDTIVYYSNTGFYNYAYYYYDRCGIKSEVISDTIKVIDQYNNDYYNLYLRNLMTQDTICIDEEALIIGWYWGNTRVEFEDGTSNDSLIVLKKFDSTGTKKFKMIISQQFCIASDTLVDSIVVVDRPYKKDFSEIIADLPDQICLGDSLSLFGYLENENYEVFWGDGSSSFFKRKAGKYNVTKFGGWQSFATHLYTSPGNYVVYAVNQTLCQADTLFYGMVNVNTQLHTNFEFGPMVAGLNYYNYDLCTKLPVQFFAYGGSTYEVDYGDGTKQTISGPSTITFDHQYSNVIRDYYPKITITNSCGVTETLRTYIRFTSDSCTIPNTNVEDVAKENVVVAYPNPTSGFFESSVALVNCEIFDSRGQLILNYVENTSSFDLSNFPSGVYFLKSDNATVISLVKL